MLLPKNDPVRELEEQMVHSHSPPNQQSTLESSSSSSQLNMPALPHLTGPHKAEQQQQQQEEQQQQQQQASELCVATYDDMDIENYINGDAHHDDEEEDDEDEEMETTTAAEQTPQQQEQHVMTYNHDDGEDDEIGAFFKAVAMKIRNGYCNSPAVFVRYVTYIF